MNGKEWWLVRAVQVVWRGSYEVQGKLVGKVCVRRWLVAVEE